MQIFPVYWINTCKANATEFFASSATKKDFAIYDYVWTLIVKLSDYELKISISW